MKYQVFGLAALLAGRATAGVVEDVTLGLRSEEVEASLRRYVDSIVSPLSSRQDANSTSWDSETEAACTTALMSLNGISDSPSGLALCYNIPGLDNATGVFQADLRLFSISPPSAEFANVTAQDIQVGLQYSGASVSAVDPSTLGKRSLEYGDSYNVVKKRTALPVQVQQYAFVGQINQSLITPDMSTAAMEKLLIPTVGLTAKDSKGDVFNTTLSSTEACFVNGEFAKASTTTTTAKAVVASPPIQTLVVAPGQPFHVPGLSILIFPIGGIITGIWAVLFIGTVSYGTVGRMQFRDQFRRRARSAEKGNAATI